MWFARTPSRTDVWVVADGVDIADDLYSQSLTAIHWPDYGALVLDTIVKKREPTSTTVTWATAWNMESFRDGFGAGVDRYSLARAEVEVGVRMGKVAPPAGKATTRGERRGRRASTAA